MFAMSVDGSNLFFSNLGRSRSRSSLFFSVPSNLRIHAYIGTKTTSFPRNVVSTGTKQCVKCQLDFPTTLKFYEHNRVSLPLGR